jgi:hypothetical protein
MRSLPILGLGIFFALAGLGLFALTLRKEKNAKVPVKKHEIRAQEAKNVETNKLRIAAAVSVAIGAALMILS